MAFYSRWFASSSKNAADACGWLGTYMQFRYQRADSKPPIHDWPIPGGEKEFFICWWMNQLVESDGFGTLGQQHPKDLEAFIQILDQVGAKETSRLIREGLSALKRGALREDKFSPAYFALVKRDKVWLKLVKSTGQDFFVRYSARAVQLQREGKNIFNPNVWQKPWKD
jgi:hypothetical protein